MTRGHFQRPQCPFKCALKEAASHTFGFVEDTLYPEAREPLGLMMDLVHLVTTEEVPWHFFRPSAQFQALRFIISAEKRFQLAARAYPALSPFWKLTLTPVFITGSQNSKIEGTTTNSVFAMGLPFVCHSFAILQAQSSSPAPPVSCLMHAWSRMRCSQPCWGGSCRLPREWQASTKCHT